MISKSKELEKWNIDLKLNPDQLDAKVLKLPTIYDPMSKNEKTVDQQLLGSLVHEPMGFIKWGIFCLNKDLDMAKHIQDKFYNLSNTKDLKIYVEYADIIHLKDTAQIDDFKAAFDTYYKKTVKPDMEKTEKEKGKVDTKDIYFFFVIMPDRIKQEHFYSALKHKINSDAPVISQFVSIKTLEKNNDRVLMNIIRQINAKLGGDLWRMKFNSEISKKTMLIGIDVCHKGK